MSRAVSTLRAHLTLASLLLSSVIILTACQNTRDALIGEWVVDKSAFDEAMRSLELTPPASGLTEDLSAPMRAWRLHFTADSELSMIINGEQLQGRYQINRAVSNTLYIRADLKPTYQSGLDEALKLTPPPAKSRTRRLSMRISGDRATLSYHDLDPIKLHRVAPTAVP